MTYFITCDFICFCVKCVAFRFLDYPHDGFVNMVDNNFRIVMKKCISNENHHCQTQTLKDFA